jgi:hypothetical protein
MFFTQDAWDRFRLTKEEFALVKEAEDVNECGAPHSSTNGERSVM